MTNITKASDSDLKAYEEKLISQQNQAFPARYNTIKMWYDTDETHPDFLGKYVLFNEGDTEPTLIGDDFTCTILATRHQYSCYPKDDSDNMHTTQFEDWSDEVVVTEGEKTTEIRGIAKWVKANYPKETPRAATYKTVLYVLYSGKVYLMRIGGASCSPWFDYRKSIEATKTIFNSLVKIGHTKEKNGTVTYYPASFLQGSKHPEADYKILLYKSFEVDKMIDGINNPEAVEVPVDSVMQDAQEVFVEKKSE